MTKNSKKPIDKTEHLFYNSGVFKQKFALGVVEPYSVGCIIDKKFAEALWNEEESARKN